MSDTKMSNVYTELTENEVKEFLGQAKGEKFRGERLPAVWRVHSALITMLDEYDGANTHISSVTMIKEATGLSRPAIRKAVLTLAENKPPIVRLSRDLMSWTDWRQPNTADTKGWRWVMLTLDGYTIN